MLSIGIRELRQRASEYVRKVEAGAQVRITDRGRPVAMLVPIVETPDEWLARMVAEGRLIPPEDPEFEDLDPLPPEPGQPLPSEVLRRQRDAEPW